MKNINGIHHITAIAGSPQKNVDFYVEILGLKFIKKTINFDDPHTYHLYYGDERGNPGTILTFFPWSEQGFRGKRGTGQIATISFSAPSSSLNYWIERLTKHNIVFAGPLKRFDEEVLIFEDYDGFELEIVANEEESRPSYKSFDVPEEHSIRGFWGASVWHQNTGPTEGLLTDLLEFKKLKEGENRIRFTSGDGGPGTYIDLLQLPDQLKGIMGIGAVHHIAFRTDNESTQLKMRERLVNKNINVTPVIDRNYFKSIYFHEPGNVLFEIATDPPGFLIDETTGSLNSSLKLPHWLESSRSEIEAVLPALKIPE
ncbi:MAG: ring-cleaving dioxygenase [Ignavibacteria bacterium]|nr:ring-cleaving dioxygenase [Ignavibacteria bacterium]